MNRYDVKAEPGDKVYVSSIEEDAIVCSVTIMESRAIKYEVRYWLNGEQKFASVSGEEFGKR